MSRSLIMLSALAVLVMTLIAAGCITSGSSAPADLPQDKLEQILGPLNYNGTAWIVIDPVGNHARGETFVVTAKTDLPPGETVFVQSWPVSFAKADKYAIRNGTSQNVVVAKGQAGVNIISLTIDAKEFREATYLISMEKSPDAASAATWYMITKGTS